MNNVQNRTKKDFKKNRWSEEKHREWLRRKCIEAWIDGTPVSDLVKAFHLSHTVVDTWLREYSRQNDLPYPEPSITKMKKVKLTRPAWSLIPGEEDRILAGRAAYNALNQQARRGRRRSK